MRKWLEVTLFGTVFLTVAAYFALFIVCSVIAFVTLDMTIFGDVLHRLTWRGFRFIIVVLFFISFMLAPAIIGYDN